MPKQIPLEKYPELRKLVRFECSKRPRVRRFWFGRKRAPKARMMGYRYKVIVEYKGVKLVLKEDGTAGHKCSHRDWQKWRQIKPEDRKFFLPIVCHGDGWVAQEYVEPIEYARRKHEKQHGSLIRRLIRKYGLDDVYVRASRSSFASAEAARNWCLIDGRPKIFDFGFAE
jgi:hypothetical protein